MSSGTTAPGEIVLQKLGAQFLRMKLRVALLPADPADGSESMWRYWHEVRIGLGTLARETIEVIEAFVPEGPPRRAGWLKRAWRQ
jgi:hypothetical protein